MKQINPILSYPLPDGSLVHGDNRHNPTPLPFNLGQPVLMNPNQPNGNNGILAQQQQGGNMRGSTRVPAMTPIERQLIDMKSEGNMRIAGAGLGALGANMTGNQAIQAATQEYAAIQDYNRQAESDALALEEDRRQAIADRMDDGADSVKGTITEVATANVKMQTAMEVLKGLEDYEYVVGLSSPFVEFYDRFTDNDRQNIRIKIKSLKVDRILSNVARTKGAISNKEMEIFASDVPSQLAGPEIWKNWVRDYAEALRVMTINLQGGATVGNYTDGSTSSAFDPPTQSNPTGSNNDLFYDPETRTFSTVGG